MQNYVVEIYKQHAETDELLDFTEGVPDPGAQKLMKSWFGILTRVFVQVKDRATGRKIRSEVKLRPEGLRVELGGPPTTIGRAVNRLKTKLRHAP